MNKSKAQLPKNSKLSQNGMTKVNAPVAKGIIQRLTKPRFSMPKNNSDGRVKICHKEYIAEINGSVLFASQEFGINPGLPLSFPWLNTMTTGYESYKFTKLKYVYESTSPTTIAGAVIIAVDFDAADSAPTTKTQIMAYHNAVRGPAWESFTYTCDKSDLAKFNQKFIRYGKLKNAQDVILYDVGNVFVATTGQGTSAAVGELHVEYEVELITPQLDLTAYATATSARVNSVGTATTLNWLGTSIINTGGVPVTLSTSPYGINILVPGQYQLTLTLTGSGFSTVSPTITSVGNIVSLATSANTTGVAMYVFLVQIDVPSSPIAISGLTTGTITSSVLRIGYYAVSLG
jgi:hypothetical protein